MIKSVLVGIILTIFLTNTYAKTDDIEAERNPSDAPPMVGNFALPAPQQPGPLIAFGQNIIGLHKAQMVANGTFDFPVGRVMNSGLIYGLTDNTSLYFNVQTRSDPLLQLESVFYAAGNQKYQEQATVVGSMSFPVNGGAIGTNYFGSPSFFIGSTWSRTYADWMGFVSPGALLTTASPLLKLGSQYYYEAGIGRCLSSKTNEYIFFGLVELDGTYGEKARLNQQILPNTGGNVVSIVPSLWLSTQKLIFQLGLGFPVSQDLFGTQSKMDYFLAASISLTLT